MTPTELEAYDAIMKDRDHWRYLYFAMRKRVDEDAYEIKNERNNMTAHELAKSLLQGPDLPVIINGWGHYEGLGREVLMPGDAQIRSFESCDNDEPKDDMGYGIKQPCIPLEHNEMHEQ